MIALGSKSGSPGCALTRSCRSRWERRAWTGAIASGRMRACKVLGTRDPSRPSGRFSFSRPDELESLFKALNLALDFIEPSRALFRAI
jgi:hypothetical protein